MKKKLNFYSENLLAKSSLYSANSFSFAIAKNRKNKQQQTLIAFFFFF